MFEDAIDPSTEEIMEDDQNHNGDRLQENFK